MLQVLVELLLNVGLAHSVFLAFVPEEHLQVVLEEHILLGAHHREGLFDGVLDLLEPHAPPIRRQPTIECRDHEQAPLPRVATLEDGLHNVFATVAVAGVEVDACVAGPDEKVDARDVVRPTVAGDPQLGPIEGIWVASRQQARLTELRQSPLRAATLAQPVLERHKELEARLAVDLLRLAGGRLAVLLSHPHLALRLPSALRLGDRGGVLLLHSLDDVAMHISNRLSLSGQREATDQQQGRPPKSARQSQICPPARGERLWVTPQEGRGGGRHEQRRVRRPETSYLVSNLFRPPEST